MKIEFLLIGIKDMEKLYDLNMVNSPFGGEDKALSYEYIGNQYCQNVITKVISNMKDVQEFYYKENIERMAIEAFTICSTNKRYTVSFTIDTYNHYKEARMRICISNENEDVIQEIVRPQCRFSDGVEYDLLLEQLKIEIKRVLKMDWNVCAWITDDQSEILCSHLYSYIFKVENKIRAFTNKILLHNFGPNWLKQPGLEKYLASHQLLSSDFKRAVPCFSDIDDTFIAMTMETMFDVIRNAKVYENAIELTEEDCSTIHKKLSKENNANSIFSLLKDKRKIKVNFWEDVFKQYFSFETDPLKIISDFIKNRNHVAHNKLLNWLGYQTMFQNIQNMDDLISKANTQFEESVPSHELYMTWDAELEKQMQDDAEADWVRNYLRIRINEMGVDVLNETEIFELFCDKINELYAEIEDGYYFNPCYKVSKRHVLKLTENKQFLFSVTSNAVDNNSIEVLVEFWLDGDMDGDSDATLICIKAGEAREELFSASLHYHNGAGHEDTLEGMIMLDSESEYDDSELDEFKQQLKEYIETGLNPLIDKLNALEHEEHQHGGPKPVADFPCYECGKQGVSIMEDFYPMGHCCYCGTDNEEEMWH